MTQPDFIGIGAQKAGTSWIHACLYEHPQIFLPASKELHFFSNYYSRGPNWYESQFRGAQAQQVIGEFSPTYLYHLDAPKRIYDHIPHAKLIICLREPLARTISAYRYAIQTGGLPPSSQLSEVVRDHPAYLEHSLYHAQVQRYLEYFRRDQMLILLYEDIAIAPFDFIRRVYEFLEVEPNFRPTMAERRVNASRGAPRSHRFNQLLSTLATTLRQAGLDHWVWNLGRSQPVEWLRRLNTRPMIPPTLSDAESQALRQRFAPDVKDLAELLNQDLTASWTAYQQRVST